MRLIDADTLIRGIQRFITEPDVLDDNLFNEGINEGLKDCIGTITSAPTVDAVKAAMPWTNPDGTETMLDEVSYEIGYSQGQKDTKRQGHWVRFHGDHICMGLRPGWDCCSECGMVGTPTRYCSNCGARMDGEI